MRVAGPLSSKWLQAARKSSGLQRNIQWQQAGRQEVQNGRKEAVGRLTGGLAVLEAKGGLGWVGCRAPFFHVTVTVTVTGERGESGRRCEDEGFREDVLVFLEGSERQRQR